MKTKALAKVLVGVIVIGGGIAYFMFQAINSSSSYYFPVDEFADYKLQAQNHSLRIAGKVKDGSIKRDLQQMILSFELSGVETSIPVSYSGVVPDNFAGDREVVVQGRLGTDGVFQAEKLMTKCESKYKARGK